MTERVRLHCLSCGYDFVAEVMTKAEKDEGRRNFRQPFPVHCPQCNRTDVRREEMRRAS